MTRSWRTADTEWVLVASDSKGWVGGRVLDARERLVDGERARHMFGTLCLQVVVAHTVNKGKHTQVSAAANAWVVVRGSVRTQA